MKNWLRIAIENGHVEHLTRIVKLCNILPFNRTAVKQSEIGKTIKKILKYKSDSDNVLTLHNEVNKLIIKWTEQLRSSSDTIGSSFSLMLTFSSSIGIPFVQCSSIILPTSAEFLTSMD